LLYITPSSKIMNVLIIEDHPLIRFGLKQLLIKENVNTCVKHTTNFPDGLALLSQEKFDLLILDIDIPGGENIRMIEMVRNKQCDIKILVHSGYDENVYGRAYIQAGADGFLSKASPPEEFTTAYQTIANQGKYLSYKVQQSILRDIGPKGSPKEKNPLSTLSKKEISVMHLLMEGKWTKEIAAILDVKENTVSTYKRRIFDKLEVTDEIQLVRKAALLKG